MIRALIVHLLLWGVGKLSDDELRLLRDALIALDGKGKP